MSALNTRGTGSMSLTGPVDAAQALQVVKLLWQGLPSSHLTHEDEPVKNPAWRHCRRQCLQTSCHQCPCHLHPQCAPGTSVVATASLVFHGRQKQLWRCESWQLTSRNGCCHLRDAVEDVPGRVCMRGDCFPAFPCEGTKLTGGKHFRRHHRCDC